MPRAQGFARGDLDTSFPLDDKFLDLRGRVPAERYYAAAGVYFHVAAATWREADRKAAIKVCPDAGEIITELQSVGLLDSEGCVPRRAFSHSVGRAKLARRASSARQAARRAGRANSESPSNHPQTDGERRTPPVAKSRNPVQKSRVVTRDITATARDAVLPRSVGTAGTEGTDTGGAGGRANGKAPLMDAVAYLEERTGRPWAFGEGSKVFAALQADVGDFGWPAVQAAMATVTDAHPDIGQLVFGASRRLHPISSGDKPAEPDPEYVQQQLAERRKARGHA